MKFSGATFSIGLVPYGIETTYRIDHGKHTYVAGTEARDYGSDDTGAFIATLLMHITRKEWAMAERALASIRKLER